MSSAACHPPRRSLGLKRAVDLALASAATVVAAPVVAAAAVGIKLSDPGPVFHRARRAGRHGTPFSILKLRTMRVQQARRSEITAHDDDRVFPFGAILRKSKIDELPQLWNILAGDMSIVGPRPEAMAIVEQNYGSEHLRTLDVSPGLASPGAIYGYTHGERLIGSQDPERDYLEKLLAVKLGLELYYVDNRSLRYDLSVMVRTVRAIARVMLGRDDLADPPEMPEVRQRYVFPVRIDEAVPTR